MVVLDSSFLVAYHNQRDVHHPAARRIMERLVAGHLGPALLLEYAFLEVVTVLLARRGLETAVRVATALLHAREIRFVPCSDIFLHALDVFTAQPRGVLSFTDAAIVAVARSHGAGVVTFDGDFEDVSGISVVAD